uniref:Uncharacterized protein n=1 Tax=Tetradesmus obliquus TaxID=3088 RepID=A0A383W1P8_TETOB|eukprot:jgi/Sobl393_1/18088/SZX71043.1
MQRRRIFGASNAGERLQPLLSEQQAAAAELGHCRSLQVAGYFRSQVCDYLSEADGAEVALEQAQQQLQLTGLCEPGIVMCWHQ